MPEPKIITITAECPECGCEFDSDIAESVLLEDPQDGGVDFECPDCDYEFGHDYEYDATTGAFTLGELYALEDEDAPDTDEEEGENDD